MIVIPLTALEKAGLDTAGDAQDRDVENFIYLGLIARGMGDQQARETAATMADAALRARAKITEATRYEIEVVEEGD